MLADTTGVETEDAELVLADAVGVAYEAGAPDEAACVGSAG